MTEGDNDLIKTEFGWAVKKDRPPHTRDLYWMTPAGNIYLWDGDGWYRVKPPERLPMKMEDLPHG